MKGVQWSPAACHQRPDRELWTGIFWTLLPPPWSKPCVSVAKSQYEPGYSEKPRVDYQGASVIFAFYLQNEDFSE